jgi:hypothetical protein
MKLCALSRFDMTNRTVQEQIRFRHLLAAYKAAFGEWLLQVRFLQAHRPHAAPDSTAIRDARAKAGNAEAVYRDSRDLLADFMLLRLSRIKASCGRRSSPAAPSERQSTPAPDANRSRTGHRSQVERLAYFLWENAGYPAGSAEADWHRAEQLLRGGM